MTPAVLISFFGVVCAIAVAGLGVVWRLGTRSTEMKMELASMREAQQRSDEAGEKWNQQVVEAVRELDGRVEGHDVIIRELQNEWRTAHRMVQKVAEMDADLAGIKAVCHDRIRCEISRPVASDDGVPELFNAERSEKHE